MPYILAALHSLALWNLQLWLFFFTSTMANVSTVPAAAVEPNELCIRAQVTTFQIAFLLAMASACTVVAK